MQIRREVFRTRAPPGKNPSHGTGGLEDGALFLLLLQMTFSNFIFHIQCGTVYIWSVDSDFQHPVTRNGLIMV